MPKSTVTLREVAAFCDRLLQPERFDDWPGASNGLQAENRGGVGHVAAAVDASLATIRLAAEAGADLLVVHHGLFWSPCHPWTGKKYELIRALADHDLAVYSAHLPLDAHPRIGNNALLARALALPRLQPFFLEKGRPIGWRSKAAILRDELSRRLSRALGAPPRLAPGGPKICRRIGVVTGGAGEELKRAAEEGIDTFVTGEGPHWTFALAEEAEINVFYGGHYATETFGVKALAAEISSKFSLPWIFIDHPSGL